MASIRKEDRPRKPWRVDWIERRRHRTRRFSSRREAVIFAGDVERGSRAPAADRLTLKAWCLTWITEAGLTWEPRTRKDRAAYLDRFVIPELGALRLGEIDRAEIRSWRAGLTRPPHNASPYTADRALSVLSAALGVAVREGLIRENPCVGHGRLARPVQRRTAATLEQIERLRAHLDAPADRAMVSLLAYAGLRPSEARALRWADVGEHTLVVRAAISGEGREKRTKTGSVRSVPLIRPLADDLGALLDARVGEADDVIVVLAPDPAALVLGEPVDHRNWTKRVWRPACASAGVAITPYQLRHTFASLHIAAGRNAWQVAALMGHSNPQMVLTTYGHLFAEAELAAPIPVETAAAKARHDALSI